MEDSQEPEHDAPRTGATASIAWLIGVSIVATGFAKVPLWWPGIDQARYWLRTGELLATEILAGRFDPRPQASR